jgi:hypothetical protein
LLTGHFLEYRPQALTAAGSVDKKLPYFRPALSGLLKVSSSDGRGMAMHNIITEAVFVVLYVCAMVAAGAWWLAIEPL